MDGFIDVLGVSGTSYRFRAVHHPSALPSAAGNFLFVRAGAQRAEVVCCGSASSLGDAASLWMNRAQGPQAEVMYVYLNISRRLRQQVHEDIADRHRPAVVMDDLDQ